MKYAEAIEWLFSTQMFGIKLGLEGPRQLLREYLAFPSHSTKVIHVAGTNGKGSTCAMIDSVARASGIRTGLFTSPHLIDYRERVRVLGQDIPEDECARMLSELRVICERLDHHPTFFEISLTLAMRWFRECECELIILETGMGGRLDATTAVPADVCAITPIGLDHTQWLGDTLEKIASEKAGIFLPGKTALSAPQAEEVERVLKMEANEVRCPLEFIRQPLEGYPISLPGAHQKWNAALAVACLHAAGYSLSYEAVHYGLTKVRWPGRFEQIERGATTIILDGAHNPHGASVLAKTWHEAYGQRHATLIFSAVAAKDISGILEEIIPLAEKVHLCPVDTPRAVAAEELAQSLPEGSPEPVCHASFQAAITQALSENPPLLLIAGSLFLVGEAKAFLDETAARFMPSNQ
jgi:dihydrofolate synthase / folylpolyglutamate synthase